MDAREAVRQVLRTSPARRLAMNDELDPDLNELQVADYIVFILALETYMGWLEEKGHGGVETQVLRQGLELARRAEAQNLEAIGGFIKANIGKASVMLLEAALRPPPTARGLALRATKLRTVLAKGGTATTKAVFGTSRKAKAEVEAAIDASVIDDPDTALNKFAALVLKNKKLEKWIDRASEVVPPTSGEISAVQEAAKGAADVSEALLVAKVQTEIKPGTDVSAEARVKQVQKLNEIEAEATESAKKALAKSGEPDRPLTKSEVIGVATAAATAVTSDPAKIQNIPPALQGLSPEKYEAVMTGGRVRVAAGAGSGKTTALLARTKLLIDEGAIPNRMVAMSFNVKAAEELAIKMAGKIGSDKVNSRKNKNLYGVRVGTMHGLFLSYIFKFGNAEQRNIFSSKTVMLPNGKEIEEGGIQKDDVLFKVVKDIWDECFRYIDRGGDPRGETLTLPDSELWKMPPKSKRMRAYLNIFQGQGMNVAQAQAWCAARGNGPESFQAGKFFEMYEGIKGALGPEWRPNLCSTLAPSVKPEDATAYDDFVKKRKAGKPRVGDFNDMLQVFRDIMRSNPAARRRIQSQLDHVMVDECQDLNPLQMEVLTYMTEHIATDDPKRSFWMVGDDKQSIYQFRGADPDNFINLDKKGFKTRYLKTNYRCAPEFVEAANKLIAKNEHQIKMDAVAREDRVKGEADLIVQVPNGEFSAAMQFGEKVLAAAAVGTPLSNFAVLARTNAELSYYQQVCAATGIRFVQKKASAVFSAKETETFRAFIQCVVAEDGKTMLEGFMQSLFSGGILSPKKGADRDEAIKSTKSDMKKAIAAYCKRNDIAVSTFDPINTAMQDPSFVKEVIMATGRDDWQAGQDVAKVMPLVEGLSLIRNSMEEAKEQEAQEGRQRFDSRALFDAILELPIIELIPPKGSNRKWTTETKTFKQSTQDRLNEKVDPDVDEELSEEEKTTLGALDFVQLMMSPNTVDPNYNPLDPKQFYAKFNGLSERAEDLRIDPDKWDEKQEKEGIPFSNRKPPPGVYLGTVHSTKGAEWPDVTVLMPKGRFPIERMPRKPGENEPPEEVLIDPQAELEAERRLGYVALTRAQYSLTIQCPKLGEKRGGPSMFVAEAGLVPGQNVVKPSAETPDEVEPLSPEPKDDEPSPDEIDEGPPPGFPPPEPPAPEARTASLQGLRDFLGRFGKVSNYERGQ